MCVFCSDQCIYLFSDNIYMVTIMEENEKVSLDVDKDIEKIWFITEMQPHEADQTERLWTR